MVQCRTNRINDLFLTRDKYVVALTTLDPVLYQKQITQTGHLVEHKILSWTSLSNIVYALQSRHLKRLGRHICCYGYLIFLEWCFLLL